MEDDYEEDYTSESDDQRILRELGFGLEESPFDSDER